MWQNSTSKPINYYNDRPFCWMGGFPLPGICNGDTRVCMNSNVALDSSHIVDVWKTMRDNRCDTALIMPYAIEDTIDHLEDIKKLGYKIRQLTSGGQIVEDFDKLIGVCCSEMNIGYGMTECTVTSALLVQTNSVHIERGDVGRPFQGVEIRIVDEEDHVVLRNTIGSIQVRGKPTCHKYLNNEAMSKALRCEGAWLRTGDIGKITDKGHLVIKGREKDIISRGTRKIIPRFIEDIVKDRQGIKIAIVVGVPDQRLGEEVCLCFTQEEGKSVSVHDMKLFCHERFVQKDAIDGLGDMPTYFLKFEDFPKLPNGKIDKQTLKKRAYELLNQTHLTK